MKIIKSKGVQPKYLKIGSLFNEQCSCTTAVSAIPGEKFPEARHRAELQLNGTHHGRSRKGRHRKGRHRAELQLNGTNHGRSRKGRSIK